MKRKGVITVFLTLTLSVIAVFILMLERGVRIYIARSEAEYAVDNAVRSCFAEYNRELFEKYHILAIDSSYKTEEGGLDRIEEHFSAYISESLSANELCSVSVSEGVGDHIPDIPLEDGETDMEGFDVENCHSSLVFSATFSGPLTGQYSITREYAYDV